jgi:hypothetical protein
VTTPYDWNNSTELRSIGDALMRISRKLHTHVHKLEIAVEGEYAGDTSDPRVRLLNEALNTSRSADLELGRLNQAMQRVGLLMQVRQPALFNLCRRRPLIVNAKHSPPTLPTLNAKAAN